MICKFAQSGQKSAVYAAQKPVATSKARTPESISFVSGSRVRTSGLRMARNARKTGRIEALCSHTAGTAEWAYQVLGLDESVVSIDDIKKAYKKMARKYHPDVSAPERVDENTRRFILVKQAYETLTNPQGYEEGAHHHNKGVEEKVEWKMQWQTQLHELKRRSIHFARMRNQT